jgi:serine protease AprX
MHQGTRSGGFVTALILLAALGSSPSATQIGLTANWLPKLDPLLQRRASLLTGHSRVIVRAGNTASLPLVTAVITQAGGTVGRSLPIIGSIAADVPNVSVPLLAANPLVARLSLDRVIAGAMERTSATVGATAAREQFGYDGSGIGVAIIDSGVTPWHDDLSDPAAGGSQRVDRFVDFVDGRQAANDDYGHGTHVAGIVAGNGFDSSGRRSGIAPGAHVIALKVLDGAGRGRISDVIAALDYVVSNRDALNIRVANLSVATGVYESYNSDPLTLAARSAVEAGIVVVAAAGNNGRRPDGRTRYGGITAPGNAPWVLTVGASSHMGTVDRADDTIAAFSSRGPTAIDRGAKPDLVAPGVGIESLSDPDSSFYTGKSPYLLSGTVATAYLPYLSLSGTSMAAPVVTGTVALMLHANRSLTPNQVKAILQSTAESSRRYDQLTQGAGFLNAKRAVELARNWSAPDLFVPWMTTGIVIGANDDGGGIVWGTNDGDGGVVWGTDDDGEGVVWGTSCSDPSCDPVVWKNP